MKELLLPGIAIEDVNKLLRYAMAGRTDATGCFVAPMTDTCCRLPRHILLFPIILVELLCKIIETCNRDIEAVGN